MCESSSYLPPHVPFFPLISLKWNLSAVTNDVAEQPFCLRNLGRLSVVPQKILQLGPFHFFEFPFSFTAFPVPPPATARTQ